MEISQAQTRRRDGLIDICCKAKYKGIIYIRAFRPKHFSSLISLSVFDYVCLCLSASPSGCLSWFPSLSTFLPLRPSSFFSPISSSPFSPLLSRSLLYLPNFPIHPLAPREIIFLCVLWKFPKVVSRPLLLLLRLLLLLLLNRRPT